MYKPIEKMKKEELRKSLIELQEKYDSIIFEHSRHTSLVDEYRELLRFLVPGFISYRDQIIALSGLLGRSIGAMEKNDDMVENYCNIFGKNNLFLEEKSKFDELVRESINKIKKDRNNLEGDDQSI
jgi:hypothetical protein